MPSRDRSVRQQGVLRDWNDERGFGFITPESGGHRAFVHVSAFPRGQRPLSGCTITYIETRDERNRPQASAVKYVGRARSAKSGGSKVFLALAVSAVFFTILAGLFMLGRLPVALVAAYGGLSLITFVMYGVDKSAAQRGQWRTSESSLHTIALLGGWPGALVARHAFRHKTTKQPFRTMFWVTVILNCSALAWWVIAPPFTVP